MERTITVVRSRTTDRHKAALYQVVSATNIISPRVDDVLKEREIQALIDKGVKVTINSRTLNPGAIK